MILKIRLIPSPSVKNVEIVSRVGALLRVRIGVDNYGEEANKMLLKFLSNYFGIKRNKVFLRKGRRGREKIVEIEGKSEQELKRVLERIP